MEWKAAVQQELERVRGELKSHRQWKRSLEELVASLRQQGFANISILDRLLQTIHAHIAGLQHDERALAECLEANVR